MQVKEAFKVTMMSKKKRFKNEKEYHEWILSLRPGNYVEIYLRDGVERFPIVDFVDRLTPSQMVIGNQRFWRNNPKNRTGLVGMEIGSPRWRTSHMIKPTEYR